MQVETLEGQHAACVIPNPYYFYLLLFQEILSIGASFTVCVSSLDLNLCSTFSSSSQPNCSDSFCINHAASSGGPSSAGEFTTGEPVTFFHYSYKKINNLYFLLASNEFGLLQLRCSDDIGLYGSGKLYKSKMSSFLKKILSISLSYYDT
jgi:hypothetical protein